MKRSIALLPLIALTLSPAVAAPAQPAPVSALAEAVKIPYEQFTLPNGLRVVVHTDRKAPVVAVSVWYHVGSKDEPQGKTGFAHLFEHLMFNGSENSPGDFFEPLQQVGATDFNGTTWFDRTNYFQTVPTAAIDRALFLESDRMGYLLGAVTQEKLDNQRGVVQNEKRQGDNQPYGLTEYVIQETLFPKGHPYHHTTIGSMADLDAASLEDVKNWFRAKYGPDNAVLVLAGDIDLATAKEKVAKWFGGIPKGPSITRVNSPVPTLAAPITKVMKDRVATTRIMRMWTIPGLNDKDATPLQVGATVLGGLSSSRLDNALVRKEQIAVSVSASADLFEQIGTFTVSADVKPGVDPALVGKRLDAIVAEFLANGPTADEVRRVATRSIAGTINGLESVGGFSGKATTLAEGLVYSGDAGHFRTELAELAAIKPAAVTTATRKWLSRPVFSLTVEPGEREKYEEAGGAATTAAKPKPTTAATPPEKTKVVGPDRSTLPPVGELTALDFPKIERAKLSNGIEVFFVQRSAVPAVQMTVSFDAGSAADPASALGTQSLMLALMDEGTATRNSVQIAEESERLGTTISTGATVDRTNVSLFALTPNLAPSLDLLSDIIRNPAFAPAEVERLRGQQLARISAELTQPQGLAGRILPVKLWGADHPYGRATSGTGTPETVKKLDRAALVAFHKAWLRPDTARIFVVGNTNLATLIPLLEKSFGTWAKPATPKPVKNFSAPVPVTTSKIYLVNRPNSPQSLIVGGQVLNAKGSDDLVTLRASNDILGGAFLSRLNMDLRETKGWSYGVNSRIGSQEQRISYTIAAPVQADKTGDSVKALRAQISDFLGKRGVTPEELERTMNGNIRELPGSFETAGDVLGGVTNIVNLNRPDNYYATLVEKYRAVTAPEIDATGRAAIDPAKLVFVIVGDAKIVRPQLDGIGLPVEEIAAPAAK
jgi:zinc protease